MSVAELAIPARLATTRTGPCLRTRDGDVLHLAVDRWLSVPAGGEQELLARSVGPVLDIGCGPGRHVVALGRRGVMALGVDIAPAAVHLARSRGALVLERSVFERVPGAGRWATALLVDGNVGIGGDPKSLLGRVATLLRAGGTALVEVGGPDTTTAVFDVRVEQGTLAGPWFAWAVVGADHIHDLARGTGLQTSAVWTEEGRWFVALDRP